MATGGDVGPVPAPVDGGRGMKTLLAELERWLEAYPSGAVAVSLADRGESRVNNGPSSPIFQLQVELFIRGSVNIGLALE